MAGFIPFDPALGAREVSVTSFFAEDLTDQPIIVGLDTPQAVTFGSAQGTVSDPIMMDSSGLITFNQSASIVIHGQRNAGRTTNNGVSRMIFWIEIDGFTVPNTTSTSIDNSNLRIPITFSFAIDRPAGGTIQFFQALDSGGNNEGGIFSYGISTTLSGLGLSDASSSFIQISSTSA